MNITFRERIMLLFRKMSKKHKVLKYPMLLLVILVLFVYNIWDTICKSRRKLASVGFILVFFAFSASFAFPVFPMEDGFVSDVAGETQVNAPENDGVTLANTEEVKLDALSAEEESLRHEGTDEEALNQNDMFTLDDLLEDNEKQAQLVTDVSTGSMQNSSDVSFEKDDWKLILINKQHPIPEGYEFSLGKIKGSMQCDERIIPDLMEMLQAAKNDGVNLVICSPYRDLARQEMLFGRKITAYMSKGASYMDAYKLASQAVTVPGASEHQIGLALDIVSSEYSSLDEGFANTPEGMWLAQHSCEYGFILRYPLGKEYITSIEYEPWHFRYVGRDAAVLITEKNLTLEEFVDHYL